MVCEYLPLSEKNASSAVTRLRRSEIIAVLYALLFVFANFGIAIAAKMPMITTTISNSIRVKPLRMFRIEFSGVEESVREDTAAVGPTPLKAMHMPASDQMANRCNGKA